MERSGPLVVMIRDSQSGQLRSRASRTERNGPAVGRLQPVRAREPWRTDVLHLVLDDPASPTTIDQHVPAGVTDVEGLLVAAQHDRTV